MGVAVQNMQKKYKSWYAKKFPTAVEKVNSVGVAL